MTIHPNREIKIALLLAKEVTIPSEYLKFTYIFLKKSANVFPEQTGAKKHVIKLEQGKKLPYELIYSLGPIEFESFKIYIKKNLANGFISALKSLANAPILFIHKPNKSFCLCVNYKAPITL